MSELQCIDAYGYYCPSVRLSGHLGLGLSVAVAITGGSYGGYLLPLLAANFSLKHVLFVVRLIYCPQLTPILPHDRWACSDISNV